MGLKWGYWGEEMAAKVNPIGSKALVTSSVLSLAAFVMPPALVTPQPSMWALRHHSSDGIVELPPCFMTVHSQLNQSVPATQIIVKMTLKWR